MYDARESGIKILVPSVNYSEQNFSVASDGSIRFGLSAVKGVGVEADKVIQERRENGKFDSFYDFFLRTNINRKAIEGMIFAGAFDEFEYNRSAMNATIDLYKDIQKKVQTKETQLECLHAIEPYVEFIKTEEEMRNKQVELGFRPVLNGPVTIQQLEKKIATAENSLYDLESQMSGIVIPIDVVEDKDERLAREHELLGSYVTANPVDHYMAPSKINVSPIGDINRKTEYIMGVISECSEKKRGSDGQPYANVVIEDRTGSVRANIFTSTYKHYKDKIKAGAVLVFKGYVRVEESSIEETEDGSASEETKSFIIQDILSAIRAKGTMYWHMSEKQYFQVTERLASFKAKYEDTSEDGYPMVIQYTDASGKTIASNIPFQVSPDAKSLSRSIVIM